jgi:hypothetical protein
MSAVVEFFFDAVESVVDAVGDVVESVVDVVADAAEWVGDTVQAVLDDPLPILLSVAGSFIGIPPMVTNAAITAARGGDLGDIALSVGTAYFAPTVGNSISSTLSSAIGDSIVNETVSNAVVGGISKGLVSGTISELKGGDFEDGFAGGFTGSLVGAGVKEVSNFVNENVLSEMPDMGQFGDIAQKALTSGVTAEITGRGSFDTAFTNGIIGGAAKLGADFVTDTIGNQFNTTFETNNEIIGAESGNKKDEVDLTAQLDDAWANTSGAVGTGAGLPDEIVEEVEPVSIEQDNPPVGAAPEFESPQPALVDASPVFEAAEQSIQDIPAEDVSDLSAEFPAAPAVVEEAPVFGGLAAVAPAPLEAVEAVDSAAAEAPEAAREDVASQPVMQAERRPTSDDALEQVSGDLLGEAPAAQKAAPVEARPIGGLQLAARPGSQPTVKKVATGALNQVLQPTLEDAFKDALGYKKPPPKRPVKRPPPAPVDATAPRPKPPVQAPMRPPVQVAAPVKKPVPVAKQPPKKVDPSTLTPISKVAGLTSIITDGKKKV